VPATGYLAAERQSAVRHISSVLYDSPLLRGAWYLASIDGGFALDILSLEGTGLDRSSPASAAEKLVKCRSPPHPSALRSSHACRDQHTSSGRVGAVGLVGAHAPTACATDVPGLGSCSTVDGLSGLLKAHHYMPLAVWSLESEVAAKIKWRDRSALGSFFKSPMPVHRRATYTYDLRFVGRLGQTGEVEEQVDGFLEGQEKTAVLIGPSGCGKSLELVALARRRFCLFIDCAISEMALGDINYRDLESEALHACRAAATDKRRDVARDLCQIDVIARYAALHHARRTIPGLTPEQWLDIQLGTSGRFLVKTLVRWLSSMDLGQRKRILSGVSESVLLVIDQAEVMRSCLRDELVPPSVSGDAQRVVDKSRHRRLLGAYAEGFFECFPRGKIIMAGTDIHLGDMKILFSSHGKRSVRPVKITGFSAWPARRMAAFLGRHLDLSGVDAGILQKRIGRGRPRWCESIIWEPSGLVSQGFSKQEAFDTAVGRVADRVVNGGDMKERILWAYDTSPDLVSRIVKSSLLSKQPWTPSDIQSAAVLAERVCYVRQSAQGQDCALRIDEVSPARWHGLGAPADLVCSSRSSGRRR
jgi:hypothetical protein